MCAHEHAMEAIVTVRWIPELFLTLSLVACAHDQSNHKVREPQAGPQAEADHGRRAEGKRRTGDEHAEHVELPRKHARRDQLASAQGVPQHEASNRDSSSASDRDRSSGSAAAEREQGDRAPTADQQGNGEIDLDLTQRIRKAVMHDESLSFAARNVKIITRDGHVTLRGRVNSDAEKDAIYQTALREAGAGHVDNQLELDQD